MMMIAASWNKPMPKITRKVGVGFQEKTEKKKKERKREVEKYSENDNKPPSGWKGL